MALLPHALLAVIAAAPAQVEQQPQDAAPRADALELLTELAAEPRIVGTPGYERAFAIVERELAKASITPLIAKVETRRAVPRRSDVLLYEDSIVESAFAGLRERWDPDAVPTMPLPAAYEWNPEAADARGPIVELGEGLAADFERVQALGVATGGAVALVSMPRAGASRKTTVREVATRAGEAGFVALLIAPMDAGPRADDFVMEDCTPAFGPDLEAAPLAIPCAPIRSFESAAIRSRLRVKRVRGDDGAGKSLRLGPGPVEARIVIECPHESLSTRGLVHLPGPRADNGVMPLVAVDESAETALGGAAAIAAALCAVQAHPGIYHRSAYRTGLVFAPRHTSSATRLTSGVVFDAVLAPRAGLQAASEGGRFGPSRLAPVVNETTERLWARLGDELPRRLDAAAQWIDYSLFPPLPDGSSVRREAERARAILLAPLPEER